MTVKRVLVVFLDGVGLGAADVEVNPFMHESLSSLQALVGVTHLIGEEAGVVTAQAALLGLDARLGVEEGLPQSGTGQTTLLTGRNAPAILGKHYGPYPDDALRGILARESIFKRLLEAGQPVAYANAYPARFLDRVERGTGRSSANTWAAHTAGLRLRGSEDLRRGEALAALLTNDHWPEPEVSLPSISAGEAGQNLARLSRAYRLTFFEFWYTDWLGHKRQFAEALLMLQRLNDFFEGILETLAPDTLFLIISDHGNFEDMSTSKHTRHPAFTFVTGAGFADFAARVESLADVAPALMEIMNYEL